MILLLNLEFCNVRSVELAFHRIGVPVTRGSSVQEVEAAEIVILPGVGSFNKAMTRLGETSLPRALRGHARERGRPLIGICLGMQLLADESAEHGCHPGLGIIPGTVERLPSNDSGDRIPNMGWSDLEISKSKRSYLNSFNGEACYFAHSYHFVARNDGDVAATITHGDTRVAAIIARDNVIGMQFHPEKSLDIGLEILRAVMAKYIEPPQSGWRP